MQRRERHAGERGRAERHERDRRADEVDRAHRRHRSCRTPRACRSRSASPGCWRARAASPSGSAARGGRRNSPAPIRAAASTRPSTMRTPRTEELRARSNSAPAGWRRARAPGRPPRRSSASRSSLPGCGAGPVPASGAVASIVSSGPVTAAAAGIGTGASTGSWGASASGVCSGAMGGPGLATSGAGSSAGASGTVGGAGGVSGAASEDGASAGAAAPDSLGPQGCGTSPGCGSAPVASAAGAMPGMAAGLAVPRSVRSTPRSRRSSASMSCRTLGFSLACSRSRRRWRRPTLMKNASKPRMPAIVPKKPSSSNVVLPSCPVALSSERLPNKPQPVVVNRSTALGRYKGACCSIEEATRGFRRQIGRTAWLRQLSLSGNRACALRRATRTPRSARHDVAARAGRAHRRSLAANEHLRHSGRAECR